jgi:hypothetical protein
METEGQESGRLYNCISRNDANLCCISCLTLVFFSSCSRTLHEMLKCTINFSISVAKMCTFHWVISVSWKPGSVLKGPLNLFTTKTITEINWLTLFKFKRSAFSCHGMLKFCRYSTSAEIMKCSLPVSAQGAVSVVTGLLPGRTVFSSRQRVLLCSSQHADRLRGPPSLMSYGHWEVRRPRREARHSSSTSDQVKNA